MSRFVFRQIPRLKRFSQSHCLPKTQRQPLARDRVYASRCVADQRNASTLHASQLLRHCDRAALLTYEFRPTQPLRQLRELVFELDVFRAFSRDCHDADLIHTDRSNVGLRAITPVDLYKFAPRLHAIEAPDSKSTISVLRRIEPGPHPDARTYPVCSDDPACAHKDGSIAANQRHAICRNSCHWSIPKQLDAAIRRRLDHPRVQRHAPQPDGELRREPRLNLAMLSDEFDASQE